ncbi:phosphoribosyltransferase [Tabrizicola sp. WMC-M-20]|nr:phosphoribosyltransferase [Tabrizicola sp. WMC-M-20]
MVRACLHLAGQDSVVLGLPRGGLPVADEVAQGLKAPQDLVLVRKIGMPGNPELALGAIAGPGGKTQVLNAELAGLFGIDASTIEAQAASERAKLVRRHNFWGARLKPGALKCRVVILVDDGIATGTTMQAAIAAVRADHPLRVVVATPIAAPETLDRLSHYADEVICLSASPAFSAVGRHYESFPQLRDEDVRAILAASVSRPAPLKN